MKQSILANCLKHGKRTAIYHADGTMSFESLAECLSGQAESVEWAGLKPESRVGVISRNSPELVIQLLCGLSRGCFVALGVERYPLAVAQGMLKNVGVQHILSAQIERRHARAVSRIEIDGATILFTSGSHGEPKAVIHRATQHLFGARAINAFSGFEQEDKWLISLPLYHAGGLAILFRSLVSGGGVIIPEPEAELSYSICKYRPTHLSLVPTQLYRLLASNARALDVCRSAKCILVGGSELPVTHRRLALEAKLPVCVTYGLTEMASTVTARRLSQHDVGTSDSGSVLDERELLITSEGEIAVRGLPRFAGYATKSGLIEPFDSDGWFMTGDLGTVGKDGRLTVIGRKDNMFTVGGENVHPETIERALVEHCDEILSAIVVPVKDAQLGSIPCAGVILKREFAVDESIIQKWTAILREQLPSFMIPRRLIQLDGNQRQMKLSRAEVKRLIENELAAERT